MTYTYAELTVSAKCYDETAQLLRKAGYDHVFHYEKNWTVIDMYGIALSRTPDTEKADAH